MALTYTPENPELGELCPDFSLPATDGKVVKLADFAGKDALLVMFICNHCPYVKAIEDRLILLGDFFRSKSVGMVGISSNDTNKYAEDSFDKMKEKKYPFPYLFDESQAVARAFGAVCTPDFFLFDKGRKLVYRGRLDDSWKDASKVTKEELKAAILSTLENRPAALPQIPSMGCSIKWKPA